MKDFPSRLNRHLLRQDRIHEKGNGFRHTDYPIEFYINLLAFLKFFPHNSTLLIEKKNWRKKSCGQENTLVIDDRDPSQRGHNRPGYAGVLPIPLDKLIKNIETQGWMKDKQLLIFDQVGKQVRWLMYYLEDRGYPAVSWMAGLSLY